MQLVITEKQKQDIPGSNQPVATNLFVANKGSFVFNWEEFQASLTLGPAIDDEVSAYCAAQFLQMSDKTDSYEANSLSEQRQHAGTTDGVTNASFTRAYGRLALSPENDQEIPSSRGYFVFDPEETQLFLKFGPSIVDEGVSHYMAHFLTG